MNATTPWTYDHDIGAVLDVDNCFVCKVSKSMLNGDCLQLKHGNLLSAAPDLLNALKSIIAASNANCGDSLANTIQSGITAIAKVEGNS